MAEKIDEIEKSSLEKINSKAEINEISEVRMSISPTKQNFPLDCHLKSLCSDFIIKCTVKEIGTGKYGIQYTPTVRGRHELSISVDGQPVAGSPFPVLVCSPPTLLDKPVKVWDGFEEPCGITVNSAGEIIVVEYDGDVVVMDRNGTRLRFIDFTDDTFEDFTEYKFEYLRSVTIDNENNIYFIHGNTDKIFRSDKDCSIVEMKRVQQDKGPGHIDIAIVEDEVMVTEWGNEGVIMVYDKELKYVRQIIGVNNDTLGCLCPDSHHNIYVCDHKNSSIQVYSKEGEFLRSFGCDKNGMEMLECPCAVCVAGKYVYVTNDGPDKIVVFTTAGNYVTSFGNYNSYGVCVDQDGFVYVTDWYHCTINIY